MKTLSEHLLKQIKGGTHSRSPDLPARQQAQQFSPPPTYSGGN
ncbi:MULTISPECIES: hypothetical protein [Pseudoalteromonas]|nr:MULTISPECIES: hypothetical protein [Pseudoalteromonas]